MLYRTLRVYSVFPYYPRIWARLIARSSYVTLKVVNNVLKLTYFGEVLYISMLHVTTSVIDDLIAYFFATDYFRSAQLSHTNSFLD